MLMATTTKCIYCGKLADTNEHIPAKQLFKGLIKESLITVPSCKECNQSYQKDEDFFRQFFSGMLMDRSKYAKQLMENEVTRSIKRRPALARQMFNQMQLVEVQTKSGSSLGKKTLYRVSDSDHNRINRVVNKIIRGLFYHHFKQKIPEDWIIRVIWITPVKDKKLGLTEMAKTLKWNVINEDIFAYGMNFVPNTYQSIWILDFFRIPLFYVLVLDKITAKEK